MISYYLPIVTFAVSHTVFEKFDVKQSNDLEICPERQKCSPGNVVSGSIRFMQIFAEVRWREGVK